MNQKSIDLMKTILKMDSAIKNTEKELELNQSQYDELKEKLYSLTTQHQENIMQLSKSINQ